MFLFHLHPHPNQTSFLSRYAYGRFLKVWGVYLSLGILLSSLPNEPTVRLSIVQTTARLTTAKAEHISAHFHESNLALNFVGNIRRLNQHESRDFRSSGLLHLLAISGGQIGFVCSVASWFVAHFLFIVAPRKVFAPHRMLQVVGKARLLSHLFFATLLSCAFGFTGPLLRATLLQQAKPVRALHRGAIRLQAMVPLPTYFSWQKIILMCALSLFFPHPFQDIGFLLSALGAACSALVARSLNRWQALPPKEGHIAQKIWDTMRLSAATTLATSVLVACVLAPFQRGNILQGAFANFLGVPLVNFVVTPLSLLALILPDTEFVAKTLYPMLDVSLGCLAKIARAFATQPTTRPFSLFSPAATLYLALAVSLFWALQDSTSIQRRDYSGR